VTGAELVLDVAVVLRPLVGVLDHQLDRRAGGDAFEHARQDPHLIRLAALRGVFVLAGFAFVHPVLDHLFGDRHTGRAAVHRGPQSRPVAFAPGGHAEKMAKAVDRHGRCSFGGDP